MCSRQRTCQKKRNTWQTVWNTNFTWKGSSQFPEFSQLFWHGICSALEYGQEIARKVEFEWGMDNGGYPDGQFDVGNRFWHHGMVKIPLNFQTTPNRSMYQAWFSPVLFPTNSATFSSFVGHWRTCGRIEWQRPFVRSRWEVYIFLQWSKVYMVLVFNECGRLQTVKRAWFYSLVGSLNFNFNVFVVYCGYCSLPQFHALKQRCWPAILWSFDRVTRRYIGGCATTVSSTLWLWQTNLAGWETHHENRWYSKIFSDKK